MEHITSRHNPLMGHIRRLAGSAAYRWETGEFLCDSPKLLQEALLWQAEITAVVTISPLPQLPEHIRQVQVPEDVMASISPVKTPQGVLFTCRLPQAPLPRSLTGRRYVLLDGVQDPVKLVVDNYPADKTEYFDIANNPNREANDATTRKVAFTKELWIEKEDFAEVPPPKFKRLTVGGEVRLMGGYLVKCESVEKNPDGSIAVIHCTADLETGNGNPADGRKVKGTIHWVSAAHAVDAEVRLYDKLFTEANMNAIPEGSDYKDYLNPESVVVRKDCKLEEALADAKPGEQFQFVRTGFFTPDSKNPGVYNRVVTLRDSFKPAK